MSEAEGKVIHFDDKDQGKDNGDTEVDHDVQYIPANINHNGNQEVKSFAKF